MTKRTYSLPSDVVVEFERAVPAGKRSAVFAEMMGEWIRRDRQTALQKDLLAGAAAMSAAYEEMERDWHAAEEEAARGIRP